MLLKKIVTGVLAVTMAISTTAAGFSAAAAKDYEKEAQKLEKTMYTGDDLGATYNKQYTIFKVWAPTSTKAKVKVFETGSDDEANAKVITTESMTFDKKTGVWSVKIPGDLKNKYYTFILTRGGKDIETADIYAKAAGVNGNRSMVVDLPSTNPEGWAEDKHVTVSNATDANVWEVSVRDFSISETSGVSEKNRGKFLAFTETGTTVNGSDDTVSTCVDYLKQMGVKYVQIMPFFDFGSIDESKDLTDQYNWGYDPKNYNVPEGSYSSNPYKGEVRIKECKQMIKALHDAGIGVIMDVVYNHTYSVDDSFFNLTVPDYYYRKNADGTWANGSGCGNDTASEHKMFSKYMVDSVTYWAEEYHIDGFRFDLMGLHDVNTMNAIRESLDKLDGGKEILMYGEAWDLATNAAEGTVLATQSNVYELNDRIGAFSDTIRDAIKGSTFVISEKGFVQTGNSKGPLKTGIEGMSNSVSGWAKVPTQSVNYASCHDNFTLYDKLVVSVKGDEAKYRTRYEDCISMNKLSAAIIYTSQGIPFIHAGEEFARSKDGEENSFNTTNEQNQLVWTDLYNYGDLVEYYKGLTQIRNSFSAFNDPTTESVQNISYLKDVPDGVVAYTLKNNVEKAWNEVCVIFNGNNEQDATVTIPEGDWVIVANADVAGLRNLGDAKGTVTVPKSSAMILVDKDGYNNSEAKADEGVVVVRYHDNDSKEVFAAKTVAGKIGEDYNVSTNKFFSMDYNIINTEGDSTGQFASGVKYVDIYMEKYDGVYSSVTFKYLDATNEGVLADSTVLSNREGQIYTTYSIPSIEGYFLDMDNLPTNGCGTFGKEDIEVVYKYNRITGDQADVCRVNYIYMGTDGKILDKVTETGKENEEYKSVEKEFAGYTLSQSPYNAHGTYVKGEVNILYIYAVEENTTVPMVVIVGAVAFLLLAGGGVFALSTIRNKKKNKASLDIED